MHDTGFPFVAREDARILILGSMPSVASLGAQQYYAHPRNAFWPVMAELLGFDARLDYDKRLQAMKRSQVALWDVAHRCIRPGSLDQHIEPESVEPNDFAGFFAKHPYIHHIFFNGAASEALYRRLVLPQLAGASQNLPRTRLPSTSPAHATRNFDAKLAAWRIITQALENGAARPYQPVT